MPDSEARFAFPKILKAYMERNHYNQTDLAKQLHVSKQTVSEWINGNKFPRVDKMQELANLFGVLMSDMYTPHMEAAFFFCQFRKSVKMLEIVAIKQVHGFTVFLILSAQIHIKPVYYRVITE